MKKVIISIFIIILITALIISIVSFSNKENNIVEENKVTSNSESNINYNNEKEVFEDYYEKAEEKLKQMTLEERVSQMFLVRCPESGAESLVERYGPGGYVLFAVDFKGKTKQQTIDMINSFQNKSKIPMIIAVDEEGGEVCRVSTNSNLAESKFKSPQDLYNEGGLDRIYEDAVEKSKLLLSLGINMNLAPVADVSTNEADYMYSRALGKNAEETCKYIETVVKAMKEENISCTLKHFPGYGNNKDSHTDATYDNRSIEEFQNSDFLPFKTGIENGAQTILVSHNIVKAIDEAYPASLSSKTHEILRNELKFKGLIMTDDLDMKATKKFATVSELAIMAVNAGNDLIITSDFETQREAVIDALNNNRITEKRINESVKRIIAYKYYMKLM